MSHNSTDTETGNLIQVVNVTTLLPGEQSNKSWDWEVSANTPSRFCCGNSASASFVYVIAAMYIWQFLCVQSS